jgi:chlorobactene glucosyltransferase
MLCCTWINVKTITKLNPKINKDLNSWPMVSVCIPARNEERNIEQCLKSILLQDYPQFEVLVLNDQSIDRTRHIVQSYQHTHQQVKLLDGKPLPPEWKGKPWACEQLSQAAQGEYLWFVDADTWYEKSALSNSMIEMDQTQADLLTVINKQITKTWAEILVVPVMIFSIIGFFPITDSGFLKKKTKGWGGANGQFLLFKRSSYHAIKGHQAVKNEIVEDIQIGQKMIQNGFKTITRNASQWAYCRMYNSFGEVWDGFSKNMFPAFNFSLWRAAGALGLFFLITILPYGLVFFMHGWIEVVIIGLIGVEEVVRWTQAVLYQLPKSSVVLHPLGCLIYFLIGLNSIRWYKWLKKGFWKGREITSSRPENHKKIC